MRLLVVCCLVFAAGQAFSRAPKFDDQATPIAVHEDGEARWADSLERSASKDCADKSPAASFVTGRPSSQPIREDADDCVLNVVVVRNDSPRPIQCHLQLEQEGPDESGQTLHEVDAVVYPGVSIRAPSSYARANPAPKSFGAKCWAIPGPPLAELTVPEECKLTTRRVPSVADFYPPGSIRRGEEGEVTVEFSTVDGSSKAQDVRVVASSGFSDLDNATLKMVSKYMRVGGGCPGQRQRMTTRFKFKDPEPAPVPSGAPAPAAN